MTNIYHIKSFESVDTMDSTELFGSGLDWFVKFYTCGLEIDEQHFNYQDAAEKAATTYIETGFVKTYGN